MKRIDWAYLRPGCKTCQKTTDYLSEHEVTIRQEVNAKKAPIEAAGALEVAQSVSRIVATKGKKVIDLTLKSDKPTDSDLKALLVGPTGNLRAPALRVGKTLLVGFDESMYSEHFGGE